MKKVLKVFNELKKEMDKKNYAICGKVATIKDYFKINKLIQNCL